MFKYNISRKIMIIKTVKQQIIYSNKNSWREIQDGISLPL